MNEDNALESCVYTLFTNRDKVSKSARQTPLLKDQLGFLQSTVCQHFLHCLSLLSLPYGVFQTFFFLIAAPCNFSSTGIIAYLRIYCMYICNLYIQNKIFFSSFQESVFVSLVSILPLLRIHALEMPQICCLTVKLQHYPTDFPKLPACFHLYAQLFQGILLE